jgi:FMN phosphatase YigB (HAD superfamily)
MIQAILMDLDNTLLENDMERFVPAYLSALGEHLSNLFPPETLIRHLLRATNAMVANTDPACTNMEAFGTAFFPALGRTREELEPLFDDFYAARFPHLRRLTKPVPAARPVLEWAFGRRFQVAIATNPLFPPTAIEQRLAWAGTPADEFAFDLITSYDIMHATKPHPAYFLEIAAKLGRRPEECLMVGDDWRMDIRPALSTGMPAYWIADPGSETPSDEPAPAGQGNLADFARWVQVSL